MKEIEVLNLNAILIQIDKRIEALNYVLEAYPLDMTLKEVKVQLQYQQESLIKELKCIINK